MIMLVKRLSKQLGFTLTTNLTAGFVCQTRAVAAIILSLPDGSPDGVFDVTGLT
jgi:hypothetical protein